MSRKLKRLTSFQTIIVGFTSVIIIGTILLMLPISSANGVVTAFHEALFTSISAVCVTGLVVQDTATYWSYFGQGVILTLIQIGGLGVITVAASFALLSGRKISLLQRSTMQEAISAPKLGGIVRLTSFMLKTTFLFEFVGACIMMPFFINDFGIKGIWMAIFHSISAFCNAGFDLMGTSSTPFSSLTYYASHPVVNIVIIALIVIGGIGFLTWEDISNHKFHIKQYRMQTKVILLTTSILIIIPTILFYIDLNDYPFFERLQVAFFQAVTPRTAGFNTIDLTKMSHANQSLMIVLMLIGGSPGSTAGGMKTTTIAVLVANAYASFLKKEDPCCFGRRIEAKTIKHAATILALYITLCFSSAYVISALEHLSMHLCLFETASAVGTVGLTLGITQQIGILSQIILMILMFLGRVGGLTLIYAALSGNKKNLSRLPQGKITVG